MRQLIKSAKSLTAAYLKGDMSIEVPEKIRPWKNHIRIEDAHENNLKHIDVD